MSLIGWWKLDGDALDSRGGHDGTLTNMTWVDGKINQAGNFDGSSGYITVSGSSELEPQLTLSLSAWIYVEAQQSGWAPIVEAAGNLNNATGYYFGFRSGSSAFTWRVGDGTNWAVVETTLNNGQWYHVTGTYDGSTGIKLFIDGVETVSATHSDRTIQYESYPFTIGRLCYSSSTGHLFYGKIDDLRFYDHALSTKEVRQLSQAKVAHWKFDDFQEPTSNLVYDMSVTGHGSSWTLQGYKYGELDVYRNEVTSPDTSNNFGFRHTVSDIAIDSNAKHITISFYANVVVSPNVNMKGYITVEYSDATTANHFWSYTPTSWEDIENLWTKVTSTVTLTSGKTPVSIVRFYVYADNASYGTMDIAGIQIETKDHATPFVLDTRSGKVADSSGYGYDAPLAQSTTPMWIEDNKIGIGAYDFDGDTQIIQVDDTVQLHLLESISVFAWARPDADVGSWNIVGKRPSNQGWIIHNSATNALRCYVHVGGTWHSVSASGIYEPGVWVHVGFTYDGETLKIYANGVMVNSTTSPSGPITKLDGIVEIGGSTVFPTQMWDGQIDDVRIYADALSANEVEEVYQQRASLDSQGSFSSHQFKETKHSPMIVDYTTWEEGTGSAPGFAINGSTAENYRITGLDPWSRDTVLWEARPDATSGADGGWNGSYFTVDNTKMYRFSVWVNRMVMGANGSFYFGTHGSGTTSGMYYRNNGSLVTNLYFYSGTGLIETEWMLIVGHIWPAGSGTGTNHEDSGRWRLDGSKYGGIARDFVFHESTTSARHRTYLYYSTDTAVRQQWAYPRVDVVDGTEPSIEELIQGHDSRNIDYVRDIGGTTAQALSVGSTSTKIASLNETGPTNGMVGWWPLNGTAFDVSRSDFDGTLQGGAELIGDSCDFGGNGDWIDLGDSLYLSDSHPFTASGWVYYRTTSTRDMMICRNNAVRATAPYTWLLGTISGSSMSAYDGGTWRNVSYSFSTSTWYHLTFAFDGTTMHYHVDGEEIGTNAYSFTDSATGRNTQIGGYAATSGDIDGKMKDIRFYDRALTSEEVGILYDLTAPSGTMMKQTSNSLYVRGQFNEVSL